MFYFPVPSGLWPVCRVWPRRAGATVLMTLMTSCSALSFAFQTEKGSALHEAALFGKNDVVRVLLAAGERWAALLSTQHAGRGLFPLPPRRGVCWLPLNPLYVRLHGLMQGCRLFLNRRIKWLWMENVGRAAGSVRGPGIRPSLRLT